MGAVSAGMPELLVVLMLLALWIIPVAAVIWALVSLYRIRSEQQRMQSKLDAIERMLQRS